MGSCQVVFDAFGLDSVEAQEVLVDCILSLKPYKDYKLAANHEQDDSKKGEINNKNKSQLFNQYQTLHSFYNAFDFKPGEKWK